MGYEGLTYGVIDLMGAGVVEIFTFEIYATTVLIAKPFRQIQRRGPPYIMAEQPVVVFSETIRLHYFQIGCLQLLYARPQLIGHIRTAETAVKAILIYIESFHRIVFNVPVRSAVSQPHFTCLSREIQKQIKDMRHIDSAGDRLNKKEV